MKALVTGAGGLLGQGIIRSIRASALPCSIIAVDPSPHAAGLYWADYARLVPLASDPAYLGAIRRILAEERPDIVLVGTDVELPLFAAHRETIEQETGVQVVVSDARVVGIADDKWLTVCFLRDCGLPFPRSCLPGDEESLLAETDFPLVVKPRRGARSVGVREVRSREELDDASRATVSPVIQELVGSTTEEFTAGVLHFPGQAAASIVMRRDLRDGNTYRAYVGQYNDLNQSIRSIAHALRPFGPANFQFRLRNGEPVVFEINARFSGTTPLRAHAGFNEVEMTLRHVILGEQVQQPPIRDLVILRHWEETVVTPAEVAAIACVPVPN